ncbi:hypothetical protein SGCOL_003887 [Colletotrichum sp. CLE4]
MKPVERTSFARRSIHHEGGIQLHVHGKYKPFNVPCFTDKPEVLETNAEGTIDELGYTKQGMILTAVVLARETALEVTTLYEQAKAELLIFAPTYTQHADFIETIKYVLQTQPYEEALQIVV